MPLKTLQGGNIFIRPQTVIIWLLCFPRQILYQHCSHHIYTEWPIFSSNGAKSHHLPSARPTFDWTSNGSAECLTCEGLVCTQEAAHFQQYPTLISCANGDIHDAEIQRMECLAFCFQSYKRRRHATVRRKSWGLAVQTRIFLACYLSPLNFWQPRHSRRSTAGPSIFGPLPSAC